jgi:hypothetical protein
MDWTAIPGATGPMRSFSVFGDATNPGDPNRAQMDRTGFMAKLIENMPRANAFNDGDGLNTAVHRWVRRRQWQDLRERCRASHPVGPFYPRYPGVDRDQHRL